MTKLSLACGLALSAALAAYSSVPKADPTATAATTAAPVSATTAAPAGTTAAKVSKTPKLVCEESEQMGSHFSQHICLTPEQVAQRRKDSQQAARDLQSRAQPISSDGKPPA